MMLFVITLHMYLFKVYVCVMFVITFLFLIFYDFYVYVYIRLYDTICWRALPNVGTGWYERDYVCI